MHLNCPILQLQSWTLIMYTFYNFSGDFITEAELEEAFIYILHKPIDFSIDFPYRLKTHMVIGLKQVRVPIGT